MSSAPASSKVTGTSDPIPFNRYVVFLAIAVVGCLLDLWTKFLVFDWLGLPGEGANRYWLVQDVFGLETSINLGALFGLGQGMSWLFATLSVVFAVVIVGWLFWMRGAHDLLLTVAFGCVMAGIFGNLYDRLGFWHTDKVPAALHYGVRDWILFQYKTFVWPNFNIADSLLVSGAGLLLIHAFRGDRSPHDKTGEKRGVGADKRTSR